MKLGQVFREVTIIHLLHLVELTVENKVNDGNIIACQIFMFLQLIINLIHQL